MVLIKGMYEEHLKAEVLKLKQQREQLRLKQGEQLRRTRNPMLINRSMEDKSSRYPQEKSQPSPSLALSSPVQEHKLNSVNYSKMFHIKQHQSTRKTSNMARSRASNTSQMYQTETIPGRKEEVRGH